MTENHTSAKINTSVCWACKAFNELTAKFCGNCGISFNTKFSSDSFSTDNPYPQIPAFAPVSLAHINKTSSELQDVAYKTTMILARERLFLYMHWLIFLCINLAGLWLAFKCYSEFDADELSRIVMACNPLVFINLVSLLCIIPIVGTRKEIYKLKNQLNALKLQIEYRHLQ